LFDGPAIKKPWCWYSLFVVTRDVAPTDILAGYRCADRRFLMSPRGLAVSNTRYLSSSETSVNVGIKGWKWHLSESIFSVQKLRFYSTPGQLPMQTSRIKANLTKGKVEKRRE
jgi:hypothetical protein